MNFSIFHNIFFDFFVSFLILVFIGLTYIASVRAEDEKYGSSREPSALVIVPCRGEDYSLGKNLHSIANQDYPNYRVVGVVDSGDDPSLPAIKKAGIGWILSDDTCVKCSGKVRAISSAITGNPGFDVYVIADSDILVGRDWLSRLLSPFGSDEIGISTTFPYFKPVGGFWSKVKLVWGFVGMGMMESRLTRFGWGGSLAFRRSLLEGKKFDFFRSYVSDDVAITKLCKADGLRIAYVKEAMPVINSPDDFKTFMEWANRQTALSIYATRNVLIYGILFYGASVLLLVSALALSIFVDYFFVIFFMPSVINSARAVKRSGKWPVTSFCISFIIPFIYLYNLIRASKMGKISWRGREYRLE